MPIANYSTTRDNNATIAPGNIRADEFADQQTVNAIRQLMADMALFLGTQGPWTPTITAVSNVDSVVNRGTPSFFRIGNLVVCFGAIDLDQTTAGGFTQFRMTLPVASNLVSDNQLAGVCVSANEMVRILGDTVNDAAAFALVAVNTSGATYTYIFGYLVN